MSLYSKLKTKNQQGSKQAKSKISMKSKTKNCIVEHIVSLSGQQSQKVYIKHGFLGRGGFANCYITQKKGSEKLMATKVIDKSNLKSNRTKMRLMNEIRIHKTFQHPNIVEFYHYFEDESNLCENQSLNQLMKERMCLTWPEIQSFTYGICKGVKYLHQKKFIHRDLKLGNIFLNEKYQIKIGDFGLTSQLQFLKQNKRTVCGTPNYIAPQVLEGTGYYFQIDIWAIGIIIYTLFYGFPPFQSEHTPQIYQKIRSCDYKFPKKPQIPMQAIKLIKSILVPDPLKRPTIQEILNSPFMKMGRGPLLQLPDCIYMSPPSKKDLESLPVGNINDNIFNQLTLNTIVTNAKNEKSTIDRTLSREKGKTIQDIYPSLHTKQSSFKAQQQNLRNSFPEVFLLQLDLIAQNAYYFRTNQQLIGVYQKDRNIWYRKYEQFEENKISINVIPLFNNLFGDKKITLYSDCQFKNILNFKVKQLTKSMEEQRQNQKKSQQKIYTQQAEKMQKTKIYHLTKVNKLKEVLLARLSNKSIQFIFQDVKDGFVYETKVQRLFYFNEKLLTKHQIFCFKEIKIDCVIETVKNFMGSIKNSSKTPNIITSITLVDGKILKIPMSKLRHIYSLIGELKNKKNRHGNTRCSQ